MKINRFKSFDYSENDKYIEHALNTPYELPSDLHSHVLISYRDLLKITRWYNDDLCWHQDYFDNEVAWYPPIGKCTDYKRAFKKSVPKGSFFVAIPEELKDILEMQLGKDIEFFENNSLDDYILDNSALAMCKGNAYKSIRQSINRFERKYNPKCVNLSNFSYSELFDLNKTALDQLKAASLDMSGPIKEGFVSSNIIEDYFENGDDFIGTAVIVADEIVAFCINDISLIHASIPSANHTETNYKSTPNNTNTSVGIYLKSNHLFPGAGTYLAVMDAKHQINAGIKYCNIMSDEGDDKLKRSKQLLRPCKHIRKYSAIYKP